jgi:hypothetical protein
LGTLVWLAAALGGAVGAEPRAELEPWISGWNGPAPTALEADWRGPFWTRRFGAEVVVERYSAGRAEELRRIYNPIPMNLPGRLFTPTLVKGEGHPPEALYQLDHNMEFTELVSELEPRHGPAMESGHWESYSSARSGSFQFSAAFGIENLDGRSDVALFPAGGDPVVADLRLKGQGVWAPQALISGSRAFVVLRARTVIVVESMGIEQFRSTGAWNPSGSQYQVGEARHGFGDPTACLDESGDAHWAAVIWNHRTSPSRPTGRVVVDGVELVQRGMAGPVDWHPELCWVRGRGLVLAIAGQSGNALVGEVRGNQFVQIAELPSVAPALAAPPPTHITSLGESYYVSTSEGLWAHHVIPPVPALQGLWLWAAAPGLPMVLVLRRPRRRRA